MSNGRELGKSSLKPYSKQGQMYKCQSCPFAVQSYTALWSHIQKHKQPARYKCDYCSFQTYGTHLMKDHLKLHKAASTTPTERPSRTKRQSNNNNYNSKSTAKVTESLQCTRCDFQAKSFKGLFWHRRVHDRLIVRNLKCKCCSYVAKSHPLLWQHVKKHRMEGGFSCSQCSFKTNLARILEYHQKQHKSKLQ